jgi:putative transposon-encoded protein
VNNLAEPVEELPSEFKVIGFEMLDREVRQSGNTGRVYLPKNWIGSRVKIIRVSKIKEKSNQKKEI